MIYLQVHCLFFLSSPFCYGPIQCHFFQSHLLYFTVLNFCLTPLYVFRSLVRGFIFLLVSRVFVIACWNNFIKAALEPLSEVSTICVIQASKPWYLLSIFSLMSWDSPGLPGNFGLYPVHFGYCVTRLWILLKYNGGC